MTKLLEWLSLATIIGVVWAGAYSEMLLPQYRTELLWSPVVLVILFGIFSVLTIIYRWEIFLIHLIISHLSIVELQHSMTVKMHQRSFRDR